MTDGSTAAIFDRFTSRERMCIIVTLRCNIECSHCNVGSSPRRHETLTRDEVYGLLSRGRELGKGQVTFSGGEVFLVYSDLIDYVGTAKQAGYEIDIETNAYWATSEETAEKRIRPLVESGLKGMCLSADAYHEKFFSTMRTVNAYRAARRLELLTEVNFCQSQDKSADEAILKLLEQQSVPYLFNPLLNHGRAREGFVQLPILRASELEDCDSLCMTAHPSGDVFACCEQDGDNDRLRQTPVFLGNVRERLEWDATDREAIVQAFHDPNSNAYFRRLLDRHPAFEPLTRRRFYSICDFCHAALSDPIRAQAVSQLIKSGSG
jgi:organic radical activating enzyme